MDKNGRPDWYYRIGNSIKLYGKNGETLHEAHSLRNANDVLVANYATHIVVKQTDIRSTTVKIFHPGLISEIDINIRHDLDTLEDILDD